jgi:serine phosphatase RsbU (regulator of sigma subunit)
MSMMGYALLNETINEGIIHPNEILNRLNIGIRKVLKQNTKEDRSNDGMDIALCALDTDNGTLEFAGANRPLFYFREGNLSVIKGDKFGVGGMQADSIKKFSNHQISLSEGDTFYACSDGYMDQFGGERGKKLMRKRFLELLHQAQRLPMNEQELFLANWFMEWKKDIEQTDDVLVMGIKI